MFGQFFFTQVRYNSGPQFPLSFFFFCLVFCSFQCFRLLLFCLLLFCFFFSFVWWSFFCTKFSFFFLWLSRRQPVVLAGGVFKILVFCSCFPFYPFFFCFVLSRSIPGLSFPILGIFCTFFPPKTLWRGRLSVNNLSHHPCFVNFLKWTVSSFCLILGFFFCRPVSCYFSCFPMGPKNIYPPSPPLPVFPFFSSAFSGGCGFVSVIFSPHNNPPSPFRSVACCPWSHFFDPFQR